MFFKAFAPLLFCALSLLAAASPVPEKRDALNIVDATDNACYKPPRARRGESPDFLPACDTSVADLSLSKHAPDESKRSAEAKNPFDVEVEACYVPTKPHIAGREASDLMVRCIRFMNFASIFCREPDVLSQWELWDSLATNAMRRE
ncbi:hypothetical protein SISNIDRAFT_468254 [Sistotremastrum niveocremeum HHB9708]|uniref:Uncharacterized protein n=1 Tax=Sistotremastrum niveocremeum HHB9708 TaxID=1314777 RepID=A0A164RNY7_9AGAM|nr:hypothetical protein SISNIDRAFT_468254 [Sistotremastrum niveocremeum HHB9708]